ncbi:anthranilate synthase component II [Psychrobacillus sp. FSL K6-1415]|uniref:anthranilate synthase component II n=1 Tax=Psychrobacillus sp. FSL K6-1415 TaxID=2921544 RepID=UPI0030F72FA3
MILLIDNYDSFTYNLYQQISMLGKEVKVIRNDAITISEIVELNPMAIIISPGPGTPAEAGISIEIIRKLYKQYPILGICLGHQSIGAAFGAKIVQAKTIMHGKISTLSYKNHALFESFNEPISVMRYHSLVIEKKSLTNQLEVIARAEDDNEIMAIKHVIYPLYGLQFHPESIGTKQGNRMMQSFIESLEISNVK